MNQRGISPRSHYVVMLIENRRLGCDPDCVLIQLDGLLVHIGDAQFQPKLITYANGFKELEFNSSVNTAVTRCWHTQREDGPVRIDVKRFRRRPGTAGRKVDREH